MKERRRAGHRKKRRVWLRVKREKRCHAALSIEAFAGCRLSEWPSAGTKNWSRRGGEQHAETVAETRLTRVVFSPRRDRNPHAPMTE